MDKYLYICNQCGREYKPNRRNIQKFCSNTCRTRAYVIRKGLNLPSKESQNNKEEKSQGMSWSGVGNAAAGTLAVNAISSLFTKEENKPATKKDLNQLAKSLRRRYYPIKNLPPNHNGTFPYYDIEMQTIVYLLTS